MIRLAISPGALAVPPVVIGRPAFEEYLEALLDWECLLGETWLRVCLSQYSVRVLSDIGAYPALPHLQKALSELEITEYYAPDIARIIYDLLTRACILEEELGIQDVSWTAMDCCPEPRTFPISSHLEKDLIRLLILLAVAQQLGQNSTRTVLSVQRILRNHKAIAVHTTIDILEAVNNSNTPSPPFDVKQSVLICADVATFLSVCDLGSLWGECHDCKSAETIIRAAWLVDRLREGVNVGWYKCPPFRIGSQFLARARCYGFYHEPAKVERLLNAIVGVLTKRSLSRQHPLRANSSPSSPQQLRGDDRAVRCDVDYEFHIHFWQTRNAGPEFASLGPHNDFTIPVS